MKDLEKFEKLDNKIDVFQNIQDVLKYADTIGDFIELFKYLTDEEKYEVIQKDYYLKLDGICKLQTLESIKDKSIVEKIIFNDELRNKIVDDRIFGRLISSFSKEKSAELFKGNKIILNYNIPEFTINNVINKLDDNDKKEILSDNKFVEELKLDDGDISTILCSIKDDSFKDAYLKEHESMEKYKMSIIDSCSDDRKIEAVLHREAFSDELLLATLSHDKLKEFISNNKSFMQEHNLTGFQILRHMHGQELLENLYKIDDFDIAETEKKAIVAILSDDVKELIDKTKIDDKYVELLGHDTCNEIFWGFQGIVPDLQRDLSIYEGMDKYLYINPYDKDYKLEDIIKLSKYCPNIEISDMLKIEKSTLQEYIEGETWVNNVISQIQPDWTDIQKLAFIDNQVGKRISYTPNDETEVENKDDERCCFKIMADGYGVCIGVAAVEKYILHKVGIESEKIGTDNHAFLKVKNIELPTENGPVTGDTLVDPTWNLANQRFNARPECFCVSYEELREDDIDDAGKDCLAHKSEELEKIKDDLIYLDDSNLRKVYKSIGLLKEDNTFQISDLMEKIEEINESSNSIKEQLTNRMEALKEYCPDFAHAINSTTKILHGIVLESSDKFNYDRGIVSRVYDKSDKQKEPVLFTYFNLGQSGELFYYADKEKNSMIPLTAEQFENRFECYERDKEKYDNKNMWRSSKTVKTSKERDTGNIQKEHNMENNIGEEER